MANFINKYKDQSQMLADKTKQYPNVYMVEGQGVTFTAECPVLLDDSIIRWDYKDGTSEMTSEDTGTISLEAATALIEALSDETKTVTATLSYYESQSLGSFSNVAITYSLDNSGHPTFSFTDPSNSSNVIRVCFINISNGGAARVTVLKMSDATATWEIGYTIEEKPVVEYENTLTKNSNGTYNIDLWFKAEGKGEFSSYYGDVLNQLATDGVKKFGPEGTIAIAGMGEAFLGGTVEVFGSDFMNFDFEFAGETISIGRRGYVDPETGKVSYCYSFDSSVIEAKEGDIIHFSLYDIRPVGTR